MSDGSTDVRTELRARLTDALRRRDRPAARVLRTTLAAVANAESVPDDDRTQSERLEAATTSVDVARRDLAEAEVRDLVEAEVHELREAAAGYRARGQADPAATVEAQAGLLTEVLDATSGG